MRVTMKSASAVTTMEGPEGDMLRPSRPPHFERLPLTPGFRELVYKRNITL